MDKQPFVSILTPVYNGEAYIRECIESVLSQSYANFEYVIINNQSTDRTVEIISEYEKLDPRIRLHHNEKHLPVIESLNNAFRYISTESKYCKVVHSDDWLFADCVLKMVDLAEVYPSVGIVSSYRIVHSILQEANIPYPSLFKIGKEVGREFFLKQICYFGPPSSILIKSELIRKRPVFYDPNYLNSDYSACLDILTEADLSFVPQILTYTRRHTESVSSTQALKNYTYMLGNLRMVMNLGPSFLNQDEYNSVLHRYLGYFYIQMIRNIIDHHSLKYFTKHTRELKLIGLKFNYIRFSFQLVREVGIRFFKLFKKS